jgi:hypothetical protein
MGVLIDYLPSLNSDHTHTHPQSFVINSNTRKCKVEYGNDLKLQHLETISTDLEFISYISLCIFTIVCR